MVDRYAFNDTNIIDPNEAAGMSALWISLLKYPPNYVLLKKRLEEGWDPNEPWNQEWIRIQEKNHPGGCVLPNYLSPREFNVGITPLLCAVSENKLDAVRMLLEHGADTELRTRRGTTALHEAVTFQHVEIVKALIECGAAMEAVVTDGRLPGCTPLFLATASASVDVTELLLKQGANVASVTGPGWTSLDVALLDRQVAMAKLLIQYYPENSHTLMQPDPNQHSNRTNSIQNPRAICPQR